MARFAPLALALLLAGCGASPTPVTPAPAAAPALQNAVGGGGGSGGFGEVVVEEDRPAAEPEPEVTPTPFVAARPTATPSPSSTPSPTPLPSADGDDDDDTASPSPTPIAVATPTPLPSATPTTKSLTVDTAHHAVLYGPASYVGGPLVVSRIEKTAFDNTSSGHPFRAMAGIDIGSYGWTYKRIESVEDANAWSSDVGNPGSVCFLDSSDGLTDNSGTWTVYQSVGDTVDNQEVRATEHVTRWSPSGVAALDLGVERSWTVSLENVRGGDLQYSFPGVILVYSHPDGGRDFRIVTGQPQSIRTRGYVYAFYLTDGANTPDQADRVLFR